MDNGLIFPYPRRNAHAEPSDANRPNTRGLVLSRIGAGTSAGSGLVVGKRWGDAGR
jgi:hypothetical protein